MGEEQKKSDIEIADEIWRVISLIAAKAGTPIQKQYEPSGPNIYRKVVDYVTSELDARNVQILVVPSQGGGFSFRLQEIKPHETDAEGNLVNLGLPLDSVNNIIQGEIFSYLHFVYWGNTKDLLKWWQPSTQSPDDVLEKFEVTKPLLSESLKEKIRLVRSSSANCLLEAEHEIRWRLVHEPRKEASSLCTAFVKLVVSGTTSTQTTNAGTVVSFELTRGEIGELIELLQMIEKKMEANPPKNTQ